MKKIQNRWPRKYYLYCLIMFIPNVGLIIGILFLRKGIIIRNRILSIIGAFGIVFSLIFFIGIYFFSFYTYSGRSKGSFLIRHNLIQVL